MVRLFLAFAFLIGIVFTSPAAVPAQTPAPYPNCVDNYRSCDTNNPCCNFPTFTCGNATNSGYCVPATAGCGLPTQPCCDPPNPRCIQGVSCSGDNYCIPPPTPTGTCGNLSQNCCPFTAGSCTACTNNSALVCLSGVCIPGTSSNNLCGGHGQPCCNSPSEPQCTASDLVCLSCTCIRASPTPQVHPAFCDVDNTQVRTALGCLPVEYRPMTITLLRWGVSVAGAVDFLALVYAVFLVTTSRGDSARLKAGRELISAAIGGLVLIILSVVILNFLGVTILNLPSFVGNPRLQ